MTENSQWDEKLLGEIFLELSKSDLDFQLSDTGFEVPEIDILIQDLENPSSPLDPLDIPSSSLMLLKFVAEKLTNFKSSSD